MKKSLLWIVVLLLSIAMVAVFSLAGCKAKAAAEEEAAPAVEEAAAEEEAAPAVEEEEEEFTMLFLAGISDPFMHLVGKGVVAKGEELGVNIIEAEYAKAWGPETQIPILEAATAGGGIDLIIIVPVSTEALVAPLKILYDQGIAIITTDCFLGTGDYSVESEFSFPLTHIGTDNKLGGVQIADKMAEMLGEKGEVFIQNTNPDTSSVVARGEGFTEEIAEYPDMTLVGEEWCLDIQQTAQEQTAAILQKYPDLAGVFGVNLFSAQGAYQAVVNAGLTGVVKIASWDATPDLINALKEGKVDLVLAQKPYEVGQLAVEAGYNYLANGVEPEKRIVPGFEFFTADNVEDPEMQQWIYQ